MDNTGNILFYGVVILLLFLLVVQPMLNKYLKKENFASLDKEEGLVKLDTLPCSPDCCRPPFNLPEHLKEGKRTDGVVYNNFTCTGGINNPPGLREGVGCVCVNQQQIDFLTRRGGNH